MLRLLRLMRRSHLGLPVMVPARLPFPRRVRHLAGGPNHPPAVTTALDCCEVRLCGGRLRRVRDGSWPVSVSMPACSQLLSACARSTASLSARMQACAGKEGCNAWTFCWRLEGCGSGCVPPGKPSGHADLATELGEFGRWGGWAPDSSAVSWWLGSVHSGLLVCNEWQWQPAAPVLSPPSVTSPCRHPAPIPQLCTRRTLPLPDLQPEASGRPGKPARVGRWRGGGVELRCTRAMKLRCTASSAAGCMERTRTACHPAA